MYPKNLFVITNPRSGSSLFVDALTSTGIVGRADEYFRELNYFEARRRYGLHPDEPIERVLREISNHERNGEGLFCAKLMGQQIRPLMKELRDANGAHEGLPLRALLEKYFGPIAFVWLRRRDRLDQAISYVKAEQTNSWRLEADNSPCSSPALLSFNPDSISRAYRFFEEDDARIAQLFENEGIEPLTIEYEDVVADLSGAVTRVLKLIGRSWSRPVQSSHRRMSDEINAEWRSAYQRWVAILDPDEARPVTLSGRLRIQQRGVQAVEGLGVFVEVELRNDGVADWPVAGSVDGEFGVGVKVNVFDENRREVFALRRFAPLLHPLKPGAVDFLRMFVGPFSVPGIHRAIFSLNQSGVEFSQGTPPPADSITVQVVPKTNPKADLVAARNNGGCVSFERYFAEAREMPYYQWRWRDGFGYFQVLGWPWLLHVEHGFWRFFGEGEETESGWWFFDRVLGLCWSSPREYPFLWVAKDQLWREYLGLVDERRHFRTYPSGNLEFLPRSEPGGR